MATVTSRDVGMSPTETTIGAEPVPTEAGKMPVARKGLAMLVGRRELAGPSRIGAVADETPAIVLITPSAPILRIRQPLEAAQRFCWEIVTRVRKRTPMVARFIKINGSV